MVGGRNYDESPFNLATEGERQPGSSFKAFDLAAALEDGISPDSVWTSKQKEFIVPGTGGKERFVVHNDEGAYSGSNTLTGATAFSDNSIYAEVGLKVGTQRIALLAHKMGITTPLSTNPAMTIGGLTVGVTPLDMAHAYETIAHGGRRVSGTLAECGDPVGIQEVESRAAHAAGRLAPRHQPACRRSAVLPAAVAQTETSMLETVLQYGTGRAAAIGQFAAGKTGTTSNYGDAWFVGWDSKYTVAVWVGYPDKLIPMTTDFNGSPVLGGTFPALIWHDFMISALGDRQGARRTRRQAGRQRNGNRCRLEHGGAGSEPVPAARRRRRARAPGAGATSGAKTARAGRRAAAAKRAPARRAPNTPPPPRRPAPAPATKHRARRARAGDSRRAVLAVADRRREPRGLATHAAAPRTAATPARRSASRELRQARRRAGAGARRCGCRPRRSARAARPRG